MSRVDLSKPQPECDCHLMDAYNSWVCEGCEWRRAAEAVRTNALMSQKYTFDNMVTRFIKGVKDHHVDALEVAIERSKNNPARAIALAEIQEFIEAVIKAKSGNKLWWMR